MTPLEDIITTASTALVATGVTIAGARKMLRHMIMDVVGEAVSGIIKRQTDFEERQGKHLDRQDRTLALIMREMRNGFRLW